MSMQTLHKIIGWVGTSMTGIILAFLPGYLNSHSPTSLKVMVGCAIGAAICGITWLLTSDKKSAELVQTTHGDHSPIGGSGDHSMTAGRDFKQITAEHYHEAMPAAPTPPIPEAPTPEFIIIGCQQERIINNGIQWGKSLQGHLGAVILVENKAANLGQKKDLVRDVSARIRFRTNYGKIINVNCAYWLGFSENAVDFRAGDTHEIVLGIYVLPCGWMAYRNERVDRFFPPATMSQMHRFVKPVISGELFVVAAPLIAEVSVISKKGETLATATYQIAREGSEDFSIEEMP